ncbi:DUF551 domain-containing protein [Pasteurella sp. PK-2025]|uniref:DUF551 domain-containing protein n=1 Tax=Pasteurella sp. PK-2025 TaxID=3413133 RepID=UPI003C76053D
MTETENKYFSVNIYDKNSISFHKSEEEAKERCLRCAENLYDLATENDNFSLYEKRLNNAVYGVVLGKVESKTRELSENEKRSINYFNCDYNVDAIIEKPEIVEFPQGNGWISVKNSLPPNHQNVLACNRIALFICRRCNDSWFSDIGMHPCEVTHWQPLPPQQKTE